MPNRLINETSPYLLQHAHNPVDWYPWGVEALQKARGEDKPIFLSIGYAACHWCHVMERESFENPETAKLLNEYFVCIKVDREERPDLDNMYMNAVVSLTGQGGWPLNVFLTPDGQPFYGGTYFPPARRYHVVSFPEVLVAMVRVWSESRDSALQAAQNITQHLQQINLSGSIDEQEITAAALENATQTLLNSYDRQAGGWGEAPKFPMPMTIEYLLCRAARGDVAAQDTATHALQVMSRGGMYDVVGGGFHRYSTDANWLIPHFEKMLYDNVLLAPAYLHAWLMTSKPEFRRTCEETLNFIQREMTNPQGGFFSSLDADSEGEEGRFYTWTMPEIQAALPSSEDFELFSAAYHLPPQGNFESRIILQRRVDDPTLTKTFNLSPEELSSRLQHCHKALLQARTPRPRPATDDKVLVSWNALALQAFAEAARYLGNADYLETARKNAGFLLTSMRKGGRLQRAWRDGQTRHLAYLEDYAALISALLSLYQSDPDLHWYIAAETLVSEMIEAFTDNRGAFYQTRADSDNILFRPRDMQDNATPSGAALATFALLKLAAYNDRAEWRDLAEKAIRAQLPRAQQVPIAFSYWLQAADFAANPTRQVALVWQSGDQSHQDFTRELWSDYRPGLVYAGSELPIPPDAPALLQTKGSDMKGQPVGAYICEGFTCKQPAFSASEFKKQLSK